MTMANSDYREMLNINKPFNPSDGDLILLANFMSGQPALPDAENFFPLTHEAFAVSDAEKIPAGYTYLGQFIDHDISHDSKSDRFKPEDRPWEIDPKSPPRVFDPATIVNLRTPNFDLETIYGSSKEKIPRPDLMQNSSSSLLKLGDTVGTDTGTSDLCYPSDLPREADNAMATIVDPRNDINLLVAQTQVAFIKFHNAVILKLTKSEKYKEEELFDKAREITIRHYQHIILKDFLPKIVQEKILDEIVEKIKKGASIFYHAARADMFIPLEFSIAAFRAGHSMILNSYNLNHIQQADGEGSLNNLMLFTGRGMKQMKPEKIRLPSVWLVNWYLFYNLDKTQTFNVADKINTRISDALTMLRPRITEENPDGRASSIAALDLFRGRSLGLPTGQEVARAMNIEPLTAAEMQSVFTPERLQVNPLFARLPEVFKDETPLWFYILAEAEIQQRGARLGEVGSRIVAETIVKILYESPFSILRKPLENDEDFLAKDKEILESAETDTEKFGMPEMLKFVRNINRKYFDELYPDREEYFDELNPLG